MTDQNQDSSAAVNQLLANYTPDIAKGMLYQSTSQALGYAVYNASTLQQQQNTTLQSSTALGISLIQAMAAELK